MRVEVKKSTPTVLNVLIERIQNLKKLGKLEDAIRAADFESTRGDFKFSSNHHPIQDIYVREVIKEGDVLTNKIVSVGLKNHSNAYVDQCSM